MGLSATETKLIATDLVSGPEARGSARFKQASDGSLSLEIRDYWVALAPDPHIFLSARDDQVHDPNAVLHLDTAPIGVDRYVRELSELDDLSSAKTLLVYCVEYDVYFGSGSIIATTD